MEKAQEKEKERIFKELTGVIEKLGEKEGYVLIIEQRAGGVLYVSGAMDITDKVIKAYDTMKQEKEK